MKDRVIYACVELGFGIVGLLGIYAAKNPAGFVQRFLAEWQRDKLTPDSYPAIQRVGAVIAISALLVVIAMAFEAYVL